MAAYSLPHFGKILSDNLDEYYSVDVEFKKHEIQIDLNFEDTTIDTTTMDVIKNFIENINEFDNLNKSYILNDYNDTEGDTVKFYIEHHLEEFEKEDLSELINFEDKTVDPKEQLLTKLKLIRIGFYPNDEDNFVIFDYSIGQEFTNYLVVINSNKKGELDYMTMES